MPAARGVGTRGGTIASFSKPCTELQRRVRNFFRSAPSLSERAHLVQMFDSTVIRAHVPAAGAKGGRMAKHSGAPGEASQPRSTLATSRALCQLTLVSVEELDLSIGLHTAIAINLVPPGKDEPSRRSAAVVVHLANVASHAEPLAATLRLLFGVLDRQALVLAASRACVKGASLSARGDGQISADARSAAPSYSKLKVGDDPL
jgi:hypothetical protein